MAKFHSKVQPSAKPRLATHFRKLFSIVALTCGILRALHGGETAGEDTSSRPLFSFGLIADVQYADKPAAGLRLYNQGLARLEKCVEDLNREPLRFVMNLGDAIDGNGTSTLKELDAVLQRFRKLKAPVHHAIGNHCLEVERPVLLKRLGLEKPYYVFTVENWKFLVLDGMDVGVKTVRGSPEWRETLDWISRNESLPTYNGAIGKRQLAWMKAELASAHTNGQQVLIFAHHPAVAAGGMAATIWNHAEVCAVLESYPCVKAWISGHEHQGGYIRKNGIHHLIIQGMVEAPEGKNAYAAVEVFPRRLVVHGAGVVPNRELTW